MVARSIKKRMIFGSLIVFLILGLLAPPIAEVDKAEAVGGRVTFEGHGRGHGVGLCMAGVYYRALRGEEYHNIIRTYYTGVSFSRVSDDMPIRVLCRDNVIRSYSLREYLYRLQEEPDSWPEQGLRVLVVAARTYTLSCIARGKHAGSGYDVCPYGSCCQAFNEQLDPARHPNTVAAINATGGEIITYGGQAIIAAYSSCCGGCTAGCDEAWGGNPVPYLSPVQDDACAPDEDHDWEVSMSWEELQAKLNSNGDTAVGTLYGFEVASRGASGRVLKIRVDGSAGSKTVSGNLFASVVGLETNFFSLAQPNFDEYLLIQNPGDADAHCTLTYMMPGGNHTSETCTVGAHSRYTIFVNDRRPDSEVSIKVESDQPVVAERAMYFNFLGSGRNDGHACMGVKESGKKWYFAEGYTGGNFDTFILVQNPNPVEAHLTAAFLGNGGVADTFQYALAPNSRMTIWMDREPGLSDGEFSTQLDCDQPVVAERAMYFTDSQGRGGGTASQGAQQPSASWYFAEGYTAENFDTWILLGNPDDRPAPTTLTFMLPDASTRELKVEVPARSRATVHVDSVPGLEQTEFSTKVESEVPIIAERAMYFNYHQKDGGHDVMGIPQLSDKWYFAEGYTAGEFDTYILLQNPGASDTTATLTYMLGNGSVIKQDVTVLAHSRYTVHVDAVPGMEQTEFSTFIQSQAPIISERAMYFSYRNRTGGSCAEATTAPATTWYFAEGYTGR